MKLPEIGEYWRLDFMDGCYAIFSITEIDRHLFTWRATCVMNTRTPFKRGDKNHYIFREFIEKGRCYQVPPIYNTPLYKAVTGE
jgi:hypothetical protein